MTSSDNRNFEVIAANIAGPAHIKKGVSCQDFFAYKKNKKRLVAVVSDGAGSAKFGKIGAKTVCETVCDILCLADFKDIRKNITFAIETAREKLCMHRFNKTKSEESLSDFSATVVGVVYEKNNGIFFHIGDGAAVAFYADNSHKISKPENGLFSCETFFYTLDNWQKKLRFVDFSDAKQICLMTDGVTGFALKKNSEPEEKFINPVLEFLNHEKNKNYSKKALINTLNSKQAQNISSDDKTFVWIGL